MCERLLSNEDFIKYCRQYPDTLLQINIKPKSSKMDKAGLYEYYHKVVLGMAIICFNDLGWTPVDKVKADYLLKAECAKIEIYNEKKDELIITTEDKANMSKQRLWQYIQDCNTFLEGEGYPVPEGLPVSHPGFIKVGRR